MIWDIKKAIINTSFHCFLLCVIFGNFLAHDICVAYNSFQTRMRELVDKMHLIMWTVQGVSTGRNQIQQLKVINRLLHYHWHRDFIDDVGHIAEDGVCFWIVSFCADKLLLRSLACKNGSLNSPHTKSPLVRKVYPRTEIVWTSSQNLLHAATKCSSVFAAP